MAAGMAVPFMSVDPDVIAVVNSVMLDGYLCTSETNDWAAVWRLTRSVVNLLVSPFAI